jgi:hypothetical protein
VRGVFRDPHGSVGVIPATISQLRLWAVPRDDGGADVYAEGDCPDDAAAKDAASVIAHFVRQQNALPVQLVTRGVLNGVEFRGVGSKVTGHVLVTADQLEALYELGAAFLNVPVTPIDPAPVPSAPRPAPRAAPSHP